MAELTTLAKVKEYLGIPDATTDDDALLTRLVTAASDYIETLLNRSFASAQYVQTENGNGRDTIVAADYPVRSVTSLTIDGRAIPEATSPTAAGYQFDEDGFYLRGYTFTRGVRNVVITYAAGYDTTPPAVEDVAITLVAEKYKYMGRVGEVSKNLGGQIVTFKPSDMTDELKNILRNYQKVVPN